MNNLLIFGSGRSGTSMMAGSLSDAGYNMGSDMDYLGKKSSNPKGFFEDKAINLLNEDILKQNVWNIPKKIRKKFFPSHTYYKIRWLARIPVSKTIKNKNTEVVEKIKTLSQQVPFCYKDPRFSYTLPVWKPLIPHDTKFIVVFREPSKTVESIKRHCIESKGIKNLKMNDAIAAEIWLDSYEHILKNYAADDKKQQWIFIHFNQIFEPAIIEKLKDFTGADFKTNFADQNISRSKGDHAFFNDKVSKVYMQLCGLASYS